jgi:uncharacterized membrane protein (UPF0127 family)
MKIKNKIKLTVVADQAVYATTFTQGMFGLIFYKKPIAMIFQTHLGIHTFFMHYPIDVIILNKQNRVVDIRKGLKPNRIFIWDPRYSKILELPAGSIENSKTKTGDYLDFIDS